MTACDVTTHAAKSADWRAREAALSDFRIGEHHHPTDCAAGDCAPCSWYRMGWGDAHNRPTGIPYARTYHRHYLAGRRARRAYDRRAAKGDAR